jgi:hypothetical protein
VHMHLCGSSGQTVHASGAPLAMAQWGLSDQIELDVAQVNHYYGKTLGEYQAKKMRRGRSGASEQEERKFDYTPVLFHHHNRNDVEELSIQRHLLAVQDALVQIHARLAELPARSMATEAQLKPEEWLLTYSLARIYLGEHFRPRKLKLQWGGQVHCNIVNDDASRVVVLAVGTALTPEGKPNVSKFNKVKADLFPLMNLEASTQVVVVFLEPSLHGHFVREARAGRFPRNIELVYLPQPAGLSSS